ncbi:MAG: peptide chain release factor N(5)-glutamine methyltransferase [Lachnospirales bacterium]
MTHKECIQQGRNALKHIDTCKLDCDILMCHILKVSTIDLIVNNYFLSNDQEKDFFKLIDERKNLKPIAYILKKKEFMGLDFYVDENVLIPRPDTEILVEETLKIIKEYSLKNFLEIGSGSGCIAIALSYYSKIYGTSVDIFEENINICKKNAKKNNVESLSFVHSDIYENINDTYDLIISNPPYIDKNDYSTLGKNVVDYEPNIALFAENEGMYFYEKIISSASLYLKDNGFIAFEIGYNQKDKVISLLTENNFVDIKSYKDYGNNDRVVIGRLKR